MSGAVTPEEQLFADLDTAAIALRLMGAEHPRLKLERIAARVAAHGRDVLEGAVTLKKEPFPLDGGRVGMGVTASPGVAPSSMKPTRAATVTEVPPGPPSPPSPALPPSRGKGVAGVGRSA